MYMNQNTQSFQCTTHVFQCQHLFVLQAKCKTFGENITKNNKDPQVQTLQNSQTQVQQHCRQLIHKNEDTKDFCISKIEGYERAYTPFSFINACHTQETKTPFTQITAQV